jgi:hypothetical protein
VDLHVGWLATLAMQVPLGMAEDVVRHECGVHVIEGVTNNNKHVVVGVIMCMDLGMCGIIIAAS